jgi:hypothetical protein
MEPLVITALAWIGACAAVVVTRLAISRREDPQDELRLARAVAEAGRIVRERERHRGAGPRPQRPPVYARTRRGASGHERGLTPRA